MANVQKKNARGHRREEKKAAARGTAPAPKKRTKAEQARWEQMELEAQAAAAKRQENKILPKDWQKKLPNNALVFRFDINFK